MGVQFVIGILFQRLQHQLFAFGAFPFLDGILALLVGCIPFKDKRRRCECKKQRKDQALAPQPMHHRILKAVNGREDYVYARVGDHLLIEDVVQVTSIASCIVISTAMSSWSGLVYTLLRSSSA